MQEIWWEKVPNAAAYISEIEERLLRGESIVITTENGFPWHDYMVNRIQDRIRERDFRKSFEFVHSTEEPGKYMLQEFCGQEIRVRYRPPVSVVRFLAEAEGSVLHDRYLWVRTETDKQFNLWAKAASEYVSARNKPGQRKAVFIIEYTGRSKERTAKGLKPCHLENYINDYDRTVFCTLTASGIPETQLLKTYLSALAVHTTDSDMELCSLCMDEHKAFMDDPYEVLSKIAQTCYRSDGSRFTTPDRKEVERKIWKAQIKVIYPELEEYRKTFTDRYREQIMTQLPVLSPCGEAYTDPDDVELGTLRYMIDNGKFEVEYEDYRKLIKHLAIRNSLSHNCTADLKDIKELNN